MPTGPACRLAQGRFRTDADGYQQSLEAGRAFTDRVWAVEGCSGIGRHVAQTRHDLARELIEELTVIDAKMRSADKQLRQLVTDHGSTLTELYGIGPSGAKSQPGPANRNLRTKSP